VTSGEQIGGKIAQEREVSQAAKSIEVVSQVEEKGMEKGETGDGERERRERVSGVINVRESGSERERERDDGY
jgi:hypothetical protein